MKNQCLDEELETKCAVLLTYFPVNQVLENAFGAQLDVNWAKNTCKSLKNK